MIATPYRRRLDTTSHRRSPVHRYRRRSVSLLAVAALIGSCEVVGMLAIVHAYNVAETTLTSASEFVWFWVGMLLLELPLVGLVAYRATSHNMRNALLVMYGLVSYAPKLLRNPSSPLYHDEFAHWRATYEIIHTGKLFEPNPIIPITSRYPGLHAAVAALVNISGLTIWQAATLLLLLFHVALVLGVAALAQSLGLDSRTASLAAFLYGLNSSFLYFDTQYAYESMAITLVVWTLVSYVRAVGSSSKEKRVQWSILTALFSAGTVITHHLSAIMLIIILMLISLAISMPVLTRQEGQVQRQEGQVQRTAVTAWSLTLAVMLIVGSWFYFVAPTTWTYLSPFLGRGFSELIQTIEGSGGSRQLFGASLSPWWEQKSSYLVTVFALGFAAVGMLLIRAWSKDGRLPRGGRRAFLFAFSFLGLAYFPSTIFIFTPNGAEGARRSWAFSWIGLAILAALAAVWLLDWAGRNAHRWRRVTIRVALMATLVVALVGGTAAGLNVPYRLPGPYLFGSDARSVTPELLATSEWFSAQFGRDNNVITDRYTGLIFGSFGLQNAIHPSGSLPFYNLYLAKPGAPIEPTNLLSNLRLLHFVYLIVDERMAYDIPELGSYFTSTEPVSLQPQGGKSPFYGKLDKFNALQWMVKVYQSDNYSVYRLNLPAALMDLQRQPPASRSKDLPEGELVVNP